MIGQIQTLQGVMARASLLLIVLIMLMQARGSAAVDLVQQVSMRDPSITWLRVLDQHGMLSPGDDRLFTGAVVTRCEIGLALVEPLRRFVALAESPGAAALAPEQQRRRDLGFAVISRLTSREMHQLLSASTRLLSAFSDVIDILAPGLSVEAAKALRNIGYSVQTPDPVGLQRNDQQAWRVTIDPNAEPDSLRGPLPLLSTRRQEVVAFPFTVERPAENLLLGVRQVNALDTAIDIALGSFRVYGMFSTLEKDPRLLIRPWQLSGSAMVGFRFNIGEIHDLGITGILEYHILRSADHNDSTPAAGLGGIGIVW